MKLAEALNQRADLQKRIAQLKDRLINNVKVQHPSRFEEAMEELKKTISRDNDRQKRP